MKPLLALALSGCSLLGSVTTEGAINPALAPISPPPGITEAPKEVDCWAIQEIPAKILSLDSPLAVTAATIFTIEAKVFLPGSPDLSNQEELLPDSFVAERIPGSHTIEVSGNSIRKYLKLAGCGSFTQGVPNRIATVSVSVGPLDPGTYQISIPRKYFWSAGVPVPYVQGTEWALDRLTYNPAPAPTASRSLRVN